MRHTATVARGLLVLDAQARCRFDAFARDHEPGLFSIASRICRSRDEAQELVQGTLEQALGSFPRLDRTGGARAWLGTVLKQRFVEDFCSATHLCGEQLTDSRTQLRVLLKLCDPQDAES